ncbi:MAG: putative ABC-type ATPase [Planctomycetota bacterium]|jgi:predicted ABC-type ATPase
MNDNKQLWMLVGGNGAGKSTFFDLFLKPKGILFINADQIAQSLDKKNTEQASYMAAKIAERLREDLLFKGISFCFETVFSHPSKIDFMAEAKAQGYTVILVFIHLHNDKLNQARVAQRVSQGGHSVPTEKIISRIPRTLDHVRRSIHLADETYILDNSLIDDPFRQVAVIKAGITELKIAELPDWSEVILN